MAYWGGGLFFYLFSRGGGGLVSYGLVVQRPISTNPRLNFNPGFFMYLFKILFRIILVGESNKQFVDKKNYIYFSFKVSGLISDFTLNLGFLTQLLRTWLWGSQWLEGGACKRVVS